MERYYRDRGMGRMAIVSYTLEELEEETRRLQERLMNPPAPPTPEELAKRAREWDAAIAACSDPQERAAMRCLRELIA